jgi:hypothetical protein
MENRVWNRGRATASSAHSERLDGGRDTAGPLPRVVPAAREESANVERGARAPRRDDRRSCEGVGRAVARRTAHRRAGRPPRRVLRPPLRLLLLVRDGREKSKFLLGHDERHWFVAAVPESARGVSGIASAMRALQPELVQVAVARERPRDPFRRKNRAYRRQGGAQARTWP